MEYTSVIIEVKKGNFEDAINKLKNNHNVLGIEKYINIVVCVCHVCIQPNAPSKFTAQDLMELISLCIVNVGRVEETEIRKYIKAIYYILKYMLDKNEYELIYQNPHIWNPSFLNNCPTGTESLTVFTTQCMLLYQSIVALHKSQKISDSNIEQLCMLLMKMIDRLPMVDNFNEKSPFVGLQHFYFLTLSPALVKKIYKYQLMKISSTNVIHLSGLKYLLDSLFKLIIQLSKREEYEHAASIIEEVTEELKSKYSGEIFNFLRALQVMSQLLLKKNLQPQTLQRNLKLIDTLLRTGKSLYSEIPEFYKLYEGVLLEFNTLNKTNNKTAIIVQLSEILLNLGRKPISKILNNTRKCIECTNCKASFDVRTNVSFLLLIVLNFRDYASQNNITTRLLEIIEETFTSLFNLIDELRRGCKTWEKHWCDAMINLYNTAVSLFRLKIYQTRVIFIGKLFVDQYFAQSNKTVAKSIVPSTLHSLLTMLCSSYRETRKIEDAFRYSALGVFYCHNKETECYCRSEWMELKRDNKQTCGNVTMVSVLSSFWGEVDESFEFTDELKLQLLNFELQTYRKVWPSKIPMATCCIEIYKFGLPHVTVQSLVCAWGLGQDEIPSELHNIIADSRKKYESLNLTVTQTLDLAVLYLLEYLTIITTASANMKNNISNEPPESTNSQSYLYGEEVLNTRFDCVSNYEELYLTNHMKTVKLLSKSLKIYKNILPKTKADLLIKKNAYGFLMHVTDTLKLQGHTVYYLKGLLLCKKIAEIIEDKISIVESIGNLIEISDINSDAFKALSKQAEDIIKIISEKLEDQAKLTIYYVHKANAFLRYGFVETAMMVYEKAKQLSVSDTMAEVKLRFLEFNLKMLPCHSSIEGHFQNNMSEPSTILDILVTLMATGRENYNTIRTHSVYFSIAMSGLVHFYQWIDQVRELRSSGKNVLNLTKCHVLPVWAAQLFGYLIKADLMSERWDDYQVKLNGLTAILNVTTEGIVEDRPTEKVNKPIDIPICSLIDNFEEMALDAPASIQHQVGNGSPLLSSNSFKMPVFLSHTDDCVCFACISIEYQNLILVEIVSKGNLWASRGNNFAAEQFFKGGIKVYKCITRRQEIYKKKVIGCIGLDLLPSSEELFAESYATLLYDYGNMLIKTRRFLMISDELINVLEKNRSRNIYLYTKALHQRIRHLQLNQNKKITPRLSPIVSATQTIRSRSITPENHMSAVSIAASVSPKPKSKRVIAKIIKFDFSDAEEVNEKKKPASISPLFNFPKTPAAPKIRVYEPRTAKQLKPVLKSGMSSASKLKAPGVLTSTLRSVKGQTKKENDVPNIVVTGPSDENKSSKRVIKKSALESTSSSSTGTIRRSARPRK